MMLNEIITVGNSGDMLSGSGRPQALKNESVTDLSPFAEDPEPRRKFFLSLLSQIGTGTVQVAPEESKNANLKLAEGQLPDQAIEENAFAGKSKEKQRKDGDILHRLPSVYPEAMDYFMGLLSMRNPPQSDLPAEPVFDVPGTENGEDIALGLTLGKLLPETTANNALSGQCKIQAGNPLMPSALEASTVQLEGLTKGQRPERSTAPELVPAETGLTQAVEFKETRRFQEYRPVDVGTVSKADLSGTGQVQAVQLEGLPKGQGLTERSATPELVPAEIRLARAVEFKEMRRFQEYRPVDVGAVSKADLSGAGQVQSAPVEGASKLHRRQQRDPFPIPDTANFNPLAEKTKSDVRENSAGQFMDGTVREKTPTDPKDDPDIRPQIVKMKSVSSSRSRDTSEPAEITAASSGTLNADENETPNMFMAANLSGWITGGSEDSLFLPPEPESGELTVNFAREAQMEKASSVNSPSNEIRPAGQSFHAEVLKQVVEKTAFTLKSGQSEIQIDLKPESLGHLRLHVSIDHQQVTVKILAENTQVKEMIERHSFLIKNELQHQGIKVDAVNVDMLMSGGSDYAYSQHEGTSFKQARHEPAFSGGQENTRESEFKEPALPAQANGRGEYLVDYFA